MLRPSLVLVLGLVLAVLPVGPGVLAAPGDITLVSTSGAGVKGNGTNAHPAVSGDGTKVAFHSFSANLTLADTDTAPDVYVKNLATGDIDLISTSDASVKGNGGSENSAISADGTKVAFSSYASNLDPADANADPDVYMKDLTTGDLILATSSSEGVVGNFHSWDPAISADGTKVAFSSMANNFDPADTDSNFDVYVKDLATGDITLASISDTGVKGNENSGRPALSADGTKVAFSSFATNLDAADTDAFVLDVYVKDLATGDLTLASTSDAGVKGNERSLEPT